MPIPRELNSLAELCRNKLQAYDAALSRRQALNRSLGLLLGPNEEQKIEQLIRAELNLLEDAGVTDVFVVLELHIYFLVKELALCRKIKEHSGNHIWTKTELYDHFQALVDAVHKGDGKSAMSSFIKLRNLYEKICAGEKWWNPVGNRELKITQTEKETILEGFRKIQVFFSEKATRLGLTSHIG